MRKQLSVLFTIALLLVGFVACSKVTTTTLTTTGTTQSTTTTASTSASTTTTTLPNVYTVTFETNGGTAVISQSVTSGGLVTAASSTKADYTFDGWYSDLDLTIPWVFATNTVTTNKTLYAKWIFSYQLTGSGTETVPYLIASIKDLEYVRSGLITSLETTYFQLNADLTIETTFEAIDQVEFNGIFEGGNHIITLSGDSGLFYSNYGTIRNLTIIGDIESSTIPSLGLFAHFNHGLIEHCTAEGEGVRSTFGTVGTMNSEEIGGAGAIAGTNGIAGIIDASQSNVNVQARVGGGGIAGLNKGIIRNSTQWGTVGEKTVLFISTAEKALAKFSYMGGIAGINYGLIEMSQNRGRVFAQRAGNAADDVTNGNRIFGGIAGYNAASGTVTKCYNAYGSAGPSVHADRIVGGIVGLNYGLITYSYSPANIGGRANIGGIVGMSDESVTSIAKVEFVWSNSNFNSGSNEEDEIGAYNVLDVSNWYSIAKFADHSYYRDLKGMAPAGTGNQVGASVSADLTTLLNTGLTAGNEVFVVSNSSSSGNTKTKLAWQKITATYIVEGVETDVMVLMGNVPEFAGVPLKNGYTFLEWRTDPVDPLTAWTPASRTTDITVYAVFAPATYTISYVLDGGTNALLNPTTFTIESALLELLPATREGATFLGWHNGTAIVTGIPSGSYGNKTLTAQWQITVDYVTVVYALTELPNRTLLDITSDILTLPTLEKAGFVFKGWSYGLVSVDLLGGAELAYAAASLQAVSGILTLTPIFEQIFTYTISFSANGALGTMDTQTAVIGTTFALPANTFTAVGYTFYGWLFNGLIYADTEEVLNLVESGLNAELVAQWYSTSIVTTGDFTATDAFTTSDSKTYTASNWFVYRNGTTTVPSLTPSFSDGKLSILATTTSSVTTLNFYAYVPILVPNMAIGKTYYVTFDLTSDNPAFNTVGVYIRSRATGSITFKTVTNRVDFTTVNAVSANYTAELLATNSSSGIVDGTNYFLLITLGSGVAGTVTFTIDNVRLYEVGGVQ